LRLGATCAVVWDTRAVVLLVIGATGAGDGEGAVRTLTSTLGETEEEDKEEGGLGATEATNGACEVAGLIGKDFVGAPNPNDIEEDTVGAMD